jgi:hypothetical protein
MLDAAPGGRRITNGVAGALTGCPWGSPDTVNSTAHTAVTTVGKRRKVGRAPPSSKPQHMQHGYVMRRAQLMLYDGSARPLEDWHNRSVSIATGRYRN